MTKIHPSKKSDSVLLSDLKVLRKTEVDTLADILEHLKVVEDRNIPAAQHFGSLYNFCRDEMNYSKDEAYMRIRAVELLREVPEIRNVVKEGQIHLTTMTKTQVAFRAENTLRKKQKEKPLTKAEKLEVIATVQAESTRDCARVLADIFPESRPAPEKTKPLANGATLIQFAADNEMTLNLEDLRNLLAHRVFDNGWQSLFREIIRIAHNQVDPRRRKKKSRPVTKQPTGPDPVNVAPSSTFPEAKSSIPKSAGCTVDSTTRSSASVTSKTATASNSTDFSKKSPTNMPKPPATRNATTSSQTPPNVAPKRQPIVPAKPRVVAKRKKRGYHGVKTVEQMWDKSGGQCEHVDASGRRCTSRYALEKDHQIPLGLGGEDAPENLRHLCRTHNRYFGAEIFGRWPKK